MECIVCKQEVEKYKAQIVLGSLEPPRDDVKMNVNICPNCGFMSLIAADSDYMKMMEEGYPEATQDDIKKIDIESVIEDIVPAHRFKDEQLIWMDPESMKMDNSREVYYAEKFKDGIPLDDIKYHRLVFFLLMDREERNVKYGGIESSAFEIDPQYGFVSFKEGFHRFYLYRYLGAKRIPVVMTEDSIQNAKILGIKIYRQKDDAKHIHES